MGLTKVTATVTNLAKNQEGFERLFLVDTGAIDCMAPESELSKAGITIEGKRLYELADGSSVECKYGFARISFMGFETITPIIFGSEDVEPILGVLALEGAGIGVDPLTRTLKVFPAIPLKAEKKINYEL
ncbi:MAG: clan AA aspartic protease [Elusimicrobiota bacterium]